MTNILLNFDPIQVRYAGGCLNDIVQAVVRGAEESNNHVPAIQLLNAAILRLDPTSSTLTSTHCSYVHLCLRAGAFADAINIIDRPIYHIPGGMDKQTEARSYKHRCSVHESSASYLTVGSGLTRKVTGQMLLEYNYMSALSYMALGQYSKAILFLEVVLVAPTANGVTHKIAIEAYKKWLLVNLLVLGSVPEYPRPVYSATLRVIRSVTKPYEAVAEAFKHRDSSHLEAEMQEGGQIWNNDGNVGLLLEVLQAHRKWSVLRMAKLFASIPVSQVDSYVPTGPESTPTQDYLQTLIVQGDLRATMTPSADGSDQILRFLPEKIGSRSEAEIEANLHNQSQQLQNFIKHVNETEHRMQISKEYVDMLKKLKKNRDDDIKQGPGGAKSTMPPEEMDEDMMGDEL
jgi:COP9 signalosome complex subunit 3